jgi:hypothetical protein
MAYIINKTDGSVVTTIIDGTLDTSTDLTLIGKNYSGFGEIYNENLVKTLENFSNTVPPTKPLVGQLWYDTSDARMKVYTSTGWKVAGGPIVSSQTPLMLTTGDLWIDNLEDQLYFYDGTDLVLAGPIWKKSQGKTGFISETVFDVNRNAKVILKLFVSDFLFGIFSPENFTPVPQISGFTTLLRGYNENSLVNAPFNTTVQNSNTLNNLQSSQFLRSDINTIASGKIFIQNNNGLTIGLNQNADLKVSNTLFIVENTGFDADIVIRTSNISGVNNALYIDSSANFIGLYTTTPQTNFDVNGSVLIRGDLTVQGNSTIINSNVVQIRDKNIELAVTSSPSDLLADGSGITIKATIDKTITYNNPTQSFDFSENINLPSGKSLRIGNVEVLTENSLTSAITSALGITSIGAQNSLIVDSLYFDNNRISTITTDTDIELSPDGNGNITLIGSPKITGLADPVDSQDAATKIYTDTIAKTLPLSVSFIDNGIVGSLDSNIILFLNDIANPVFFANQKIAYVHIQHLSYSSPDIIVTRSLKSFIIQNNQWLFLSDLPSSI